MKRMLKTVLSTAKALKSLRLFQTAGRPWLRMLQAMSLPVNQQV